MIVAQDEIKEALAVKGYIPKSLKMQFKIFCVKNNLEMSEVLETLIMQWIQSGSPILQAPRKLVNEELAEIKGYIPKPLKEEFKTLCKQNRRTMGSILYALIIQSVKQDIAGRDRRQGNRLEVL